MSRQKHVIIVAWEDSRIAVHGPYVDELAAHVMVQRFRQALTNFGKGATVTAVPLRGVRTIDMIEQAPDVHK